MCRFIILVFLFGLLPCSYGFAQSVEGASAPKNNRPTKLSGSDDGDTPSPSPLPMYTAEAFIGTWEWRSGADVFRMTLSRNQSYRLPNGESIHVLLGQHSFTRNGVLVEESYTPNVYTRRGWSLLGRPHEDWSINLIFSDLTKRKSGKAFLTIDPNMLNQLHFELQPMESVTFDLPNSPPLLTPGFTIPTTMTLTRVQ